MTEDCVVANCPRKASGRVSIVPICNRHGIDIAKVFRGEVLELAKREDADRTERAHEKREQSAGNREGSLVYYVQIGDYIKIGFSTRLRRRYATLRADRLLAIEPGGPELERARHRDFAADRIDMRRENFRQSQSLLEHIADLRDCYGLPHWATEPRTSIITRAKGKS